MIRNTSKNFISEHILFLFLKFTVVFLRENVGCYNIEEPGLNVTDFQL